MQMGRISIGEWEPIMAEDVLQENGGQILSDENTESLESVYTNLPEVYLYGEFAGTDGSQMEAYLGEERLDFIWDKTFQETGDAIYYYVLLDISGSIPDAYFSEIKSGILEIQENLRAQDRLVLCAFGEEVRLLSDGSQDEARLEEILNGLDNGDQQTLLFEAMAQMSSIAEGVKAEECRRRVMVVFSDGEDIAVGKKQAQEALANLKDKGIPLYAMCIGETDRSNINSFGEFARNTGGKLILLEKGGILQASSDLTDELLNMRELKFSSDGNRVTNKRDTVTLHLKESDRTLSMEVINSRWIPDTVAPTMEKGEIAGDRLMRIRFSEPVLGSEDLSNYQVTLNGERVAVSGISQGEPGTDSVFLSLGEDLQTGTYYVECINITDNSMEKNPVQNSVTIEAVVEKEPEPEDNSGPILLLVLAVLILAAAVAAAVGKLKKRTDKEKEPQKDFVVNAEISMEGKPTVNTQWKMAGSLIIGRGMDCDVRIDEPRVSSPHFLLERKGKRLYLTDLKSKNGTRLNGKAAEPGKKTAVASGDSIQAGPVRIRIRW